MSSNEVFLTLRWNEGTNKKDAFFGSSWGSMVEGQANATALKTGDGLVVVDIDVKDLDLIDQELVELLPDPTYETARGFHYYFMVEDDSVFKTVSDLFDHVDMRANGGVIFTRYWGGDERISYEKVGMVNEMSQELRSKLLTSKRLTTKVDKMKDDVPLKGTTANYTTKTDINQVREILSFIDPDIEYGDWVSIGMGLKDWDDNDGFHLFDEWSSKGTKYDETVMQTKWESFKGTGVTVATVVMHAKANGYVPPVTEYGFDPVEVEEVEVPELIAPQAWFNKATEKYCLREGENIGRYTKAGFKQVLLSKGKKIKGSEINIPSLWEDYEPTCGIMAREGVLNTFTPSRLMNVSAPYGMVPTVPPTISLLFDNVFADDALRAGFINWLAYIYQERRKTGVVWIFKGVQGSGKGIVAETIMRGLFEHNMICNLTDTQMNSQFNSIMEDKMIVHFNEISAEERRDRMAVKNKLKTWITDDTLVINSKGVKEYYKTNHMNIVINTNEAIPVDIDDKDRRFTVVHTGTPLIDLDWFVRGESVDEICRELEAFAVYLSKYKVDKVAACTAVMTEDKQNIISVTMSNAEGIAKAICEGDFGYFLDSGLEDYVSKIDGFYSVNEIEKEFYERAISNQNLGVLISSVYGKEMTSRAWSRTIMTKYGIGERFMRKINGKVVRGFDLPDTVTIDALPF